MIDPTFTGLETPRLVIRRFAPPDARALAAYRSDPEVARLQDWACPYPLAEAERFVAGLASRAPGTPGTWFQFAVELASTGEIIGDVALRTGRTDSRQAELGFTFATAHQGRGHATEAVRAVLGYAFGRLAMHRVISRTDVRNVRGRRLLERTGFRLEGELREATWFKGEWATDLLYAQLAREWDGQPATGLVLRS